MTTQTMRNKWLSRLVRINQVLTTYILRSIELSLLQCTSLSLVWIPDEDLNDQVLFLGFNTAFSLPASSTNSADCKGNRIYCTDDTR